MKTAIKSTALFFLATALVIVTALSFAGCDQNKISKLVIDSTSAKTQYYVGDYFELGGLRVLAELSNGKNEIVKFADNNKASNGGYTIDLYKKQLATADTSVTIKYKGKTAKVEISVQKRDVQMPNASEIAYSATANTITIQGLVNAEYKISDGIWQDSNTFGGLDAGKTYKITIRYKETDAQNASDSVDIEITTAKGLQGTILESQILVTLSPTSITVQPIAGAEYRLDNGEWQDSNVFADLTPGQKYDVKVRRKETATLNPSAETTKTYTLPQANNK